MSAAYPVAGQELGQWGGPALWRVRPVFGPAVNTAAAIKTRAGLLFGWSAQVGAAAGNVLLYDGIDNSGKPSWTIGGPANYRDTDWFGPTGIWCQNGLYITGNANVTVYSIFWVDLYD